MNNVVKLCRSCAAVCAMGMLASICNASDECSLVVTVLDPHQEVVADARVTLIEKRQSAYVDEKGRVRFDDLTAGSYHVEAVSRQFGAIVNEVTLTEGERLQVTLELARSVHYERIIVTATPGGRGSAEVVTPVNTLDKEELRERMRATIGETLAQEPGVHSSSFGVGASRPIIRGQSGGRVRLLEDGVGVGDASTISPDHAVSSDPLSAEAVEILRGPSALLYDSGAIGGLVNILDRRIPDHAPRKKIGGSLDLRLSSVNDERTGAIDLTGGGSRFAWHLDGVSRESEDYELPGSGELPNSFVESSTMTLGASTLFDRGFVGVSARGFESEYGIQEIELSPVGAPPEEEEEGGVSIDMEQKRFDLRGRVDRLDFAVGVTDYEHTEFEGAEVGTRFFNESREARVEFAHRQESNSPGIVGTQFRRRDARAVGDEAFVPENRNDSLALFALQEVELGSLRWEFGGRFERNDVSVGRVSPEIAARIANNGNCTIPEDSDFNNLSASVGAVWLGDRRYAVGASVSHAVRAPGGEELYSCGPHLSTQSFEVGNSELGEETAHGLELSLRKRQGRVTGEINLFSNRFDDYIFEEFTGRLLTEEGEESPEAILPEFRFRQADATFYGAELQALIDLFSGDRHHLDLEFSGDVVRAELQNGENLPRIPAARYGFGFHYRGDRWYGAAAVSHTQEQDRLAPSEMISSAAVEGLEQIGGATDSYTSVNASVGFRLVRRGVLHDLSLRGSNLTDETIRVHTSRLKNVAPQPGVDLSVAYRLVF